MHHPEFVADVLISSQYPRARETAEIIAPALTSPGQPAPAAVIDDGFGEHDPGPECDGMSYDEFVERYSLDAWRSNPFATSFPGGETLAAFQYRIGAAMHRTLDRHPGRTIVVACHGGVIDAALRLALKAPATGAFDLWTRNTAVTEMLLVEPNHWRIVRYGDAAHLAPTVAG
jgi:probable phosphoglycerate mutase